MEVPAWAFSNLCIGRTYDTKNNRAGIDIFQPEIPTKTENVNRFSFRYKIIKSKEDVRDLLNISGNISLKIKANIFKVEGAGKYINNNTKDEGVTEVLAVMKCTTVNKTMDGSANAKPKMVNSPSLGTHYVRSVTYGAEMIASLKFKSSSSTEKSNLTGKLDGSLDIQGAVNAGLEAQLKKLTSDCNNASDLSIEYYATDLPDKNPTNLDDLVKLIQEFPSRLEKINDGQGVPIKLELLPIENIFHELNQVSSGQALECDIDEIESRYDDLCQAQRLVKAYRETEGEIDDEMRKFNSYITKTLRTFRSAISTLDETKVKDCLEAYEKAVDENDDDEKFVRHWRDLLKKKVPSTDIKLPSGNDLTFVLLGKTGNGKSATGNRIIGRDVFKSSSDATSVTEYCKYGSRSTERNINVIDTPGVIDTGTVKHMSGIMSKIPIQSKARQVHEKTLTELCKMFAMAPQGFDAIILTVKFGNRFTNEDGQALRLLQDFMGKEAKEFMILLLTWGDQAEHEAEEKKMSIDDVIDEWLNTMPPWVQNFIKEIKSRVILFNNRLREEKDPEAFKKQLSQLIETVDKMNQGKHPFVNSLTAASKEVLDERIKKALDSSEFTVELEHLKQHKQELESQINEANLSKKDREELEKDLLDVNNKIEDNRRQIEDKSRQEQAHEEAKLDSGGAATEKVIDNAKGAKGGCFPGSSNFVDKDGCLKAMKSLQIGEQVHVFANEGIRLEAVITFIHREPEELQEFLSITTTENNNLKITEDHLLFVEKKGHAIAIPARDVKIGDTVFIKQNDVMNTGLVQDISSVFEKGVYAPVTLSGTLLVNDVHTSCYFDVLSHEWSHRAMGVARAVYHVSPWMLQCLSGVGEKDGFPGWCRLAQKILTWLQ